MGSRLAGFAFVLGMAAALSSIGCARGSGGMLDTGGGGLDVPSFDARGADVASRDAPLAIDGAPADLGGMDAGSTTGGLDPALDVPPASNEVCMDPGDLAECSGIAVCRFYSASDGRCESCVDCGNLFDPCSSGEDCDILFVCFMGRCTNFCTLGSSECGPPTDCIDIGHPTRGACRPGP